MTPPDRGAEPPPASNRPPLAQAGQPSSYTADLAIVMLTYNNAQTAGSIAATAARGVAEHLPGITAAIVNCDAGSSDGTQAALAAAGLPMTTVQHDAPANERVTVPFHGVPGRDAALRAGFDAAHRLGARVAVLLEADVVSATAEWVPRLAWPILDDKADFVGPVYARHRYEGTITRLLLSPLVRALYGRRLHHPLGGQQALSGRLIEHLLLHPKWDWGGRDASDLWITGTAIADGFAVWETWLGRYVVKSGTRTGDLPTMVAQTLGAAFSVMERHGDLWLEVRGSEPLPSAGEPEPATVDVVTVDVDRMLDAFHRGATDLGSIWELILAPDTLGSVLSLDVSDPRRFVFPDDLWARVVYDFALGHHYGVVHRDHLLRSLVPIYLGRTAAFVTETLGVRAAATDTVLENVALAFERQKPYLVEHWR
jgi:glucosylglycerate synthase